MPPFLKGVGVHRRSGLLPRPHCGLFGLLLISHTKDGVAQRFLERRVVAKLLEQFGVVGQKVDHDALQRGVWIGDPGPVELPSTFSLLGSNSASRRRMTLIGRITSRYLPRT